MRAIAAAFLLLAVWPVLPSFGQASKPDSPYVIDTQRAGEHPPSAEEAAELITLPEGFQLTLFAGDPDLHQPIAFDFDDRGRLWVIECYTYEGGEYDLKKRDRILIFHDHDGDGRFDSRKVFWDRGQRLTGLTLGFGGVWLTSAPNLLFIADKNGDDQPDGEPKVVLEGFSTRARHNMVNGLRWGPDGWLYGRHGITDTSKVGTPDTPAGKRVALNCSIWRYHPQRRDFQVVTNGTTNPWGLDYDDHGQWFFTNNVINHLWHVVPGAHYQRMFGDDFNPHLYRLIQPTADHFHWDTAGQAGVSGNKNRKKYDGRHDSHGGGHSHAGGMIYLGDNWPQQFRGKIFMCNTHGRRVNSDRLVRKGNSYSAQHEPDFLKANNDWFRGVELKYGPDGGVYLSDWSDLGECHDRDGVHRSSGRLYKITHQRAPTRDTSKLDLQQASDVELAMLQLHKNDWFVRRARRILQERAAAGGDLSNAKPLLERIYHRNRDVTRRLRALWALHSIGAIDADWLSKQLQDPEEHVRVWAVRLLVDSGQMSRSVAQQLAKLANSEASGLVRLQLASALQSIHLEDRWPLASNLAAHQEDAQDRVQPLMLWYGIEAAVPGQVGQALELAEQTQIPLLRRHIARRITSEIDADPQGAANLTALLKSCDETHVIDYLLGMSEAFQGRRRVSPPSNWNQVSKHIEERANTTELAVLRELSVVFGDGRAVDELLKIVSDGQADPSSRRNALRVVLESRPPNLVSTLLKLKNDRIVGPQAIRGLARYENPQVPKQLLAAYKNARHGARPAIIEALASRPSYAAALLDAMQREAIERDAVPAAAAATIASHNDAKLTKRLETLWGAVRTTPQDKLELIGKHRASLTRDSLAKADLSAGRRLFNKSCANCHKLFGQGKAVGPDLTGSNRDNLDYLLENIVDPSRAVPTAMRQSAIRLKDGRLITGTVLRQNQATMSVHTASQEETLAKDDIESIRQLSTSLMPEGLLTPLNSQQVRDLIAYLQASAQVDIQNESAGEE